MRQRRGNPKLFPVVLVPSATTKSRLPTGRKGGPTWFELAEQILEVPYAYGLPGALVGVRGEHARPRGQVPPGVLSGTGVGRGRVEGLQDLLVVAVEALERALHFTQGVPGVTTPAGAILGRGGAQEQSLLT